MRYSLARYSDIKVWSLIGSVGVLLGYGLMTRVGPHDVPVRLVPIVLCGLAGGGIGAAIPLLFSVPCDIRVSEDAASAFEGAK